MDGSHRSLEGWPDAITFRLLRFLSHLFGRVHSCIRRSVRCKRRPKSNLAILGCFDVFDKISITDAVQLLRIANSNAFSVVSHRVCHPNFIIIRVNYEDFPLYPRDQQLNSRIYCELMHTHFYLLSLTSQLIRGCMATDTEAGTNTVATLHSDTAKFTHKTCTQRANQRRAHTYTQQIHKRAPKLIYH